jgi:hypothetical protein
MCLIHEMSCNPANLSSEARCRARDYGVLQARVVRARPTPQSEDHGYQSDAGEPDCG